MFRSFLALLPCCFLASSAFAQGQAAAPPSKNLIPNGNFERFSRVENLQDGVDSTGHLAGITGTAYAVNEAGNVGGLQMPLSVATGDLNGDGLPDIMMCNHQGQIRVYFNKGTRTEPKFTHAEVVPIYLNRYSWLDEPRRAMRQVLRVALADLGKTGKLDLIIGNYSGEIYVLPNIGTNTSPVYGQPRNIEQIMIPTRQGNALWGNLFAPAAGDFNSDGKVDILVGEGSYSANAVHLFLNETSGNVPKLSWEGHHFLAYGDGREQLIPAVVDYNGDGNLDLLVGDRTGALNIYLSSGRWAPNVELKHAGQVAFGNSRLSGGISPAVADFNGDGLFDIVIGKSSIGGRPYGRIAIAFNTGTKEQPKFGNLQDIKGVDAWGKDHAITRSPNDWTVDFGARKGNFNGYTTVIKEDEDPDAAPFPEGKHAFKAAYYPSLNEVIRYQPLIVPIYPIDPKTRRPTREVNDRLEAHFSHHHGHNALHANMHLPTNMMIIRQVIGKNAVRPNKAYNFSFKHRGRGIQRAAWAVSYHGHGEGDERSFSSRTDRGGGVVRRDQIEDSVRTIMPFSTGGSWGEISRRLDFTFANKKVLNEPDKHQFSRGPNYSVVVEVRALLSPGEGAIYLDDFKLTE